MSDKGKKSTSLFQTLDRGYGEQHNATDGEVPIGMPKGDNSTHTVNDVVQPSITVQAAIQRLKATRKHNG